MILLFLLATTAAAAELPRYWSVHIDTPRGEDRDDYEQAGREQAVMRRQILADHKVERQPVFSIRTSNGNYYSFRPRGNFAEFDNPDQYPEAVRDEIRTKVGSIDDRVHATLLDHHSEIWETEDDLTWVPKNASRARGYARLLTMRVKPDQRDEFEAVMKKFREAVGESQPDDVVLTFHSTYGSGAFQQLWLSNDAITGMREVFRQAFGEDEADDLMAQWRNSILNVHITPARPRPDLTATTPENWLWY